MCAQAHAQAHPPAAARCSGTTHRLLCAGQAGLNAPALALQRHQLCQAVQAGQCRRWVLLCAKQGHRANTARSAPSAARAAAGKQAACASRVCQLSAVGAHLGAAGVQAYSTCLDAPHPQSAQRSPRLPAAQARRAPLLLLKPMGNGGQWLVGAQARWRHSLPVAPARRAPGWQLAVCLAGTPGTRRPAGPLNPAPGQSHLAHRLPGEQYQSSCWPQSAAAPRWAAAPPCAPRSRRQQFGQTAPAPETPTWCLQQGGGRITRGVSTAGR